MNGKISSKVLQKYYQEKVSLLVYAFFSVSVHTETPCQKSETFRKHLETHSLTKEEGISYSVLLMLFGYSEGPLRMKRQPSGFMTGSYDAWQVTKQSLKCG